MPTRSELLALFPDNTAGEIGADDLRSLTGAVALQQDLDAIATTTQDLQTQVETNTSGVFANGAAITAEVSLRAAGDAANTAAITAEATARAAADAALAARVSVGEAVAHLPTLPGYEWDVDLIDSPLYQNTGATTPVTADGQNILAIGPMPGSLVGPIVYTGGVGPTQVTENGVPVFRAAGPTNLYKAFTSGRTGVTEFTLYVLFRLDDPSGATNLLTLGYAANDGAGPPLVVYGATNGGYVQGVNLCNSAGSETNLPANASMAFVPATDTKWHLLGLTYKAGKVWVTFDGAVVGPGDTSAGGNYGSVVGVDTTLPENARASVPVNGYGLNVGNARVAKALGYTVGHDVATHRQVYAAVRARFAALFGPASDPLVVFQGSSNFASQNAGVGAGVPNKCRAAAVGWSTCYTLARGGASNIPLRLRVPDEAAQLARGRTGVKVAVLYAGGNDNTAYAGDPAAAYAGLLRWAAGVKAAGYTRVILCTVLPGQWASGPRATLNASIRNGAAANGYTVADLAADATIGGDTANASTTYYKADGIHLTAAGTTAAAAVITPVVNAAVAAG